MKNFEVRIGATYSEVKRFVDSFEKLGYETEREDALEGFLRVFDKPCPGWPGYSETNPIFHAHRHGPRNWVIRYHTDYMTDPRS